MNDSRLDECEDATPLERRLLAAGRARREPEGMRERVLGAVSAAAAGTAVSATVAARSSWAGVITKGKIILLSVVLLIGGATVAHVATRSPAVARSVQVPAKREPVALLPAAEVSAPVSIAEAPPAEVVRAQQPVVVRKKRAAPASDALSALREEAAAVERVRVALSSGDAVRARDELARAEARFPHGSLGEERAALVVRVTAALGDVAGATRRARAFLARYPASPLRPSVEALAQPAAKTE